jgi:anti-sigma factor (TIGR02949 family)
MSCRQALSVVQEFLDGELDHVSEAQVKAHFEVCARCYPHLRLEESFRAALQRASLQETAPPGLRGRVEALLTRTDPG